MKIIDDLRIYKKISINGAAVSHSEKFGKSFSALLASGSPLNNFPGSDLSEKLAVLYGIYHADGRGRVGAAFAAANVFFQMLDIYVYDAINEFRTAIRRVSDKEFRDVVWHVFSDVFGRELRIDDRDNFFVEDSDGVIVISVGGRNFTDMDEVVHRYGSDQRVKRLISVDQWGGEFTVNTRLLDVKKLDFSGEEFPPLLAAFSVASRRLAKKYPDFRRFIDRLSDHHDRASAIERLSEILGINIVDGLAHFRSHLLDLSPSDFERASAAALSGILGIPFRQASSGRQPGGDAGGGSVRLEAKRYREGIPSSRDLLGGLASICHAVPDLSHWVVASTAGFPLQAADELRVDAEKRLVRDVILDWPTAGIPPLAGALVAGRGEVGRHFPDLAPILAHLAENPDLVKAGEDVRAALRAESPGRPIYDPVLHYVDGKVSGAAALNPAYRLVPFMNRDQELADVVRWAMQGNQPAYLLTGGGGMGKTRLMIEACVALRAEGCRAGFLRPKCDFKALRTQLSGSDRFLIVVDYAERRGDDIKDMCRLIAEMRATDRIRLALLARNGGVWHDKLLDDHHARAFLDAMVERQLEPAAPRKADHAREDRRQVLEKAVRAFASCREGKDVDAIMTALHGRIDFDREEYNTILDLLMEAWVPVFGSGSSANPMDEIVRWERRYLGGLAPDPLTADTMMEVLGWVYANEGAATRKEAIALLTQCPSLNGLSAPLHAKIAEIFHDCYGGPSWLNPIQPDRVGHAVQQKYGP
jgi:hypothetical protein